MEKDKLIGIEPSNPNAYTIMWKTGIGLIVWLMVSFFIFIMLMIFSWMFEEAVRSSISWWNADNPLLSLVMLVIAFVGTMVWNSIIIIVYNIIFNDKYYDLSKMMSLWSIINVLLFFIIAPIYILFYNNIEVVFFVLAFHIFFSIFITYSITEFSTNPNYSGVHIIWTTIALSISFLIFSSIYKNINLISGSGTEFLLTIPCILAYTLTPLIHWLWEKLYYKFYEMGNNFLYIPSIDEVLVEETEVDEINVDND